MNIFKKIIKTLENFELKNTLLFFIIIVLLRTFIETMYGVQKTLPDYFFLVESYLWFFSIFSSFAIITKLITNENSKKIINVFAVGGCTILIAPIISYLITGGIGEKMQYVTGNINELASKFITFYANAPEVSWGMKIEIIVISIMIIIYLHIKTKNIIKSILSIPMLYYPIGFLYGSLSPIICNLSNYFGIFIGNVRTVLGLILLFNILFIIFLENKNFLKLIYKDLFITRYLHYSLMALFGFFVYIKTNEIPFQLYMISKLIILLFTCLFSFQFAMYINYIYDYHIDKLTNKGRLLFKNITKKQVKNMSIFFFFMAILFSTILGSLVCILVFFALILSLIYSAPPIRLRQYIFSNLIIGACSTLAYTIGYASLFNQIDNISIPILVTIFVSISLGTVIKDLKDIKSDEKNGVSTIPIKFGKIASAFCVGLAFSLPPILLNAINFILPSFIAAIIAILIVLFNKNKTQERNFFILYYLFAIYFVYSLFFIQ